MEHRSSSPIQPHRQGGGATCHRVGQWHQPSHTASKLCPNGPRHGSEAITHPLLLVCVSLQHQCHVCRKVTAPRRHHRGHPFTTLLFLRKDLHVLLIMSIIIIAGMAVRSSNRHACATWSNITTIPAWLRSALKPLSDASRPIQVLSAWLGRSFSSPGCSAATTD